MRRLRILHAVSVHGSVTAAATALGYSGPAVSQQLAALEREVGVTLTDRAGRGIVLTAAADILVAHTEVLLSQLGSAEADIAQLRDQIVGAVSIGTFPSAGSTILPPAWVALARCAPHVSLDMCEMEPEDSVPALVRGELDIAIAHEYDLLPRPLDPMFERRELLTDPVFVAVGTTVAISADTDIVALHTLAGEDFVLPGTATSCAEMSQRACAQAGFVPHVVARATDFQVLLALVAAGVGVTLVPELAARHLPAGVRLLRPSTAIIRTVFALSRRGGDRTPAVRVVLDALSDAAASHYPRPAAAV